MSTWISYRAGKMTAVLAVAIMVASLIAPGELMAQTGLPSRQTAPDVERIVRDLPRGDRWIRHLKEDLLPFWEMKSALGEPLGNFPTYRNNDGSLVTPDNPGKDFKDVVPGIVWLDRDYVRAKSRQAYAYGVAYHMTGDERYLQYAKAGVDYLRKNAFDREHGGAYTYFDRKSRETGPAFRQRTSQDLAYALTGMGFLYYLTRDKELLGDLVDTEKYIFDRYYSDEQGLIRWVLENSDDGDKTNQKELVAQLDQVYGYMLLTARALPEPHRARWLADLTRLSHLMMEQFYAPSIEMFWGAVTTASIRRLGTPHTDFGHSVKTFWLISQIGALTDDFEMYIGAQQRAAKILERAYIERNGSWARALDAAGNLDEDKEWWIFCELDQVSGALALNDPSYARYLIKTYDYWFTNMIDQEHHEAWHMVSGATNRPVPGFPKQHSWKNAYHTFEHALVGYFVAQQLHDKPTVLYFAFDEVPDRSRVYPYFYKGLVESIEQLPTGASAQKRQKVTFTDLH